MARAINRLSARRAATLKTPGLHADGNGLYLNVSQSGAKSWRAIYQFNGKRYELGLGSHPPVTLAEARDEATKIKQWVKEGINPKSARMRAANDDSPSFGVVATELIDGLEAGWKNEKHRQQWRNTLATYATEIWDTDVALIDVNSIIRVLKPIWLTKPETANRVRGRIERVLDAAKVRGLRSGDNPALWRGNLALLLPARKAKGQQRHHPAMLFIDVPAFMTAVKTRPAISARALEFTILTAARTSETLHARWSEIDLDARLWTVPANRMKAGKVHRVPLSDAAISILTAMAKTGLTLPNQNDFIFPGSRSGKPLSNMSMEMLLRRMQIENTTVHGFRSSFRDWAGEMTHFPREIAEAALAHSVGNEVERAYRRGDALDKRRDMMTAWSEYLGTQQPAPRR